MIKEYICNVTKIRIKGHALMTNYNLERFIKAQENMYYIALSEIKSAGKYNHWMWFIFPQIAGLGSSY